MKAKGHRWVGLRQNEDSCSKVLECSDPLLIVMPKMRSADGKITVPTYDGGCASDLGDKMFINSLDLGLVSTEHDVHTFPTHHYCHVLIKHLHE